MRGSCVLRLVSDEDAPADLRVAQLRHALGERQRRELPVGRPVREGMEGRSGRSAAWSGASPPAGASCAPAAFASRHELEDLPPLLLVDVVLRERERDRAGRSPRRGGASTRPPSRARRGPRPSRRRARARRGRGRARRARGRCRRARPRRRSVPGTGSPSIARCTIVRDVEKPSAPASIALAHDRRHLRRCRRAWPARSSRRARPSRRRAPRRAAPACRRRARSGRARARRGTRGSVSQPQRMPSASAVPGMSSTPSISPIRNVLAARAAPARSRRRSCPSPAW